ncbi:unnamed protein product [Closterium sp. Naga37s-1]|nr:unnamed protein product [Closterium sp. Naga37s-1]
MPPLPFGTHTKHLLRGVQPQPGHLFPPRWSSCCSVPAARRLERGPLAGVATPSAGGGGGAKRTGPSPHPTPSHRVSPRRWCCPAPTLSGPSDPGFSSSLVLPTPSDPSDPVLPASAAISSVDRVRGPFNPARMEYIQQDMRWDEFEQLLEAMHL